MKCPCCNGTGQVAGPAAPVYLSPLQLKLYNIVRYSPHGIQASALVTRLYADDPEGGPDYARISMRVTVKRANDRLAAANQRICGGGTQLYRLQNVV